MTSATSVALEAREALGALALQIRTWRQQHEMTQADLAARSGMSVSFISMIERGERSPSYDTLVQLARSLDVSLAELFRAQGDAPREDGYFRELVDFARDARLSRRQVDQLLSVARAMFDLPGRAGQPQAQIKAPEGRRCSVPGCERPLLARGLCPSHYRRKLRQRRAAARR